MTGASRGVGLEVAIKFAEEGYNIAFVAKTVTPNPKLIGTVQTAEKAIRDAGASEVLAIPCDVRNLEELKLAIEKTGDKFGKIDLLINNASAIFLLPTSIVNEKQYDLMHNIIVRASLFAVQYALPFLEKSSHANIINIAPKVDLNPKWFINNTAYTLCKFASAMMVTGLAAELANKKINVNAVWPAKLLKTAAVQNLLGGDAAMRRARTPRIMADAILYLISQNVSGKHYLDEELIKEAKLNLSAYADIPENELLDDFYV